MEIRETRREESSQPSTIFSDCPSRGIENGLTVLVGCNEGNSRCRALCALYAEDLLKPVFPSRCLFVASDVAKSTWADGSEKIMDSLGRKVLRASKNRK